MTLILQQLEHDFPISAALLQVQQQVGMSWKQSKGPEDHEESFSLAIADSSTSGHFTQILKMYAAAVEIAATKAMWRRITPGPEMLKAKQVKVCSSANFSLSFLKLASWSASWTCFR